MWDGSLICVGKGNEEWNCSAQHGAGRLMSRKEAKTSFTVLSFKKETEGIYTTSVRADILDEKVWRIFYKISARQQKFCK